MTDIILDEKKATRRCFSFSMKDEFKKVKKMGFDLQRFPNGVDEELICSICSGVLEDPLQAPTCEHAFCGVEINHSFHQFFRLV